MTLNSKHETLNLKTMIKKLFINLFLWYLRTAAKIQLWKTKPKIIALTGSSGKTSLKNAIEAVLQDKFKVKKSIKANSETGLPLDILGLHVKDYSGLDWLRLALMVPIKLLTNWQHFDYYIAELGVDDPNTPKNMKYLLEFIHPDISVFLNVAPVHTQQFEKAITKDNIFLSNQEKLQFLVSVIAKEKGKIITSLNSDKIAIVNADDSLIMGESKKSKAKLYYFGKDLEGNKNHELKIINYKPELTHTIFTYKYLGKTYQLKLPYVLASYYSYTFGSAILAGLSLGLNIQNIIDSLLANFKLPSGRMSLFKGIKNTIIIDSSYNASAILKTLELIENLKALKKVIVLGDMRELGELAKIEHEKAALKIIKVASLVVLIGPLTKQFVYPITKIKIPTYWFSNSFKAGDWLRNNLRGGELILVKGSQNTIFTEIVVEKLLADQNDSSRLCRRGKFWDKQRQATLLIK